MKSNNHDFVHAEDAACVGSLDFMFQGLVNERNKEITSEIIPPVAENPPGPSGVPGPQFGN